MKKDLRLAKRLGRMRLILSGLFLFFFALSAQAQTNLAPLATTNGQGSGGTTPYLWNWNYINDNNITSCGNQEAFIWTNSPPDGSEWMEWAWSTQYPINSITIHHAQTQSRFLTGGTVQYWNGSAWIDHYNFSGLNPANCSNVINFPTLISNKLRIAKWQMTNTAYQISNPNFREIQIWQGIFPGSQLTTSSAVVAGGYCGTSSDNVTIKVINIGQNTLSNIPVNLSITGTLNGSPFTQTASTTIAGPLASLASQTVVLGNFNTLNGANLSIKAWAYEAADPNRADDTVRTNYFSLGTPSTNPSPTNNSRCGSGSVTLDGGIPSGLQGYWYNQSSGGTLLGVGKTFNTPNISAPSTNTYYVASGKMSGDSSLSRGYAGGNYAGPGYTGGSMFTVAINNPITLDSIAQHLYLSNNQDVSIYYKTGTYVGFEYSPGSWTKVDKVTVRSKNLGQPTFVKLSKPLYLTPGNYAFYVFANENLIFEAPNSTNLTKANYDLTITGGISLRDSFNTSFGAYYWNGAFYYHGTCISNTRVAVTATAKALPTGSDFTKGSPFNGTFNAGIPSFPDVIANPDDITYDITPPSGFVNSGYGSSGTWNIVSQTATTSGGTAVAFGSTITFTSPSGSTNAKVKFTPPTSLTDSTVTIKLTLRRYDTGCDSVITRVIYVAPRPVAGYNGTSVCLGDPAEFKNTSTILSGTMSYLWDFGDGTNSNLAEPVKLYTVAGNYTVKLFVTSGYGYVDSSVQTVAIKAIPKANFKFVNACEGAPVTFADNSTLPSGTASYVWKYGDGSPDGSGATTSRQYATPGIYLVTMNVSVNGCSNTVSKYVTQAPRGTVDFSMNVGQCDNKTVQFTNAGTNPEFGTVSYTWNFGDGVSATEPNAAHTYNSFNPYKATLIAKTDLGCIDSISKTVTLKESPIPSYTQSGGVCNGEEVHFSNTTSTPTGTSNSFSWKFGDGNTSGVADPAHSYSTSGTFTVTLTATNSNGCVGQKDFTVTIGEKPDADFVSEDVCLGSETVFKNNSNINNSSTLTYNWNLDPGTSTSDAPKVTYTTAGAHNVTLIAEAGGCYDTATKTVNVNAIPTVNILFTSNNTGDGKIRFSTTSSGTGYSYLWKFSDGGSSTDQNPTYKFLMDGRWEVSLLITSPEGCSNTIDTAVKANSLSTGAALEAGILNVYPNPSNGTVSVSLNNEGSFDKVVVTDVLGRVVKNISVNISSVNTPVQLNLSDLNSGTYMLHFEGVNTSEAVKISIIK